VNAKAPPGTAILSCTNTDASPHDHEPAALQSPAAQRFRTPRVHLRHGTNSLSLAANDTIGSLAGGIVTGRTTTRTLVRTPSPPRRHTRTDFRGLISARQTS